MNRYTGSNFRIKKIREYFFYDSKRKNLDFAEKMGENANTVSNWINNEEGVGATVISKILNKFPSISREWLEHGIEPMLITNYDENKLKINESKENNNEFTAEKILKQLSDSFENISIAQRQLTDSHCKIADSNITIARLLEKEKQEKEATYIAFKEVQDRNKLFLKDNQTLIEKSNRLSELLEKEKKGNEILWNTLTEEQQFRISHINDIKTNITYIVPLLKKYFDVKDYNIDT